MNRDLVREVGRRCPDQRIATIDQDTTIDDHWQPQTGSWPTSSGTATYPQACQGLAVAKAAYAALPSTVKEEQWEPYGKPDTGVTRECADVLFVPGEHSEQKDLQPLRYVAVRIRHRHGGLLEEGTEDRHFAVLTNTDAAWLDKKLEGESITGS